MSSSPPPASHVLVVDACSHTSPAFVHNWMCWARRSGVSELTVVFDDDTAAGTAAKHWGDVNVRGGGPEHIMSMLTHLLDSGQSFIYVPVDVLLLQDVRNVALQAADVVLDSSILHSERVEYTSQSVWPSMQSALLAIAPTVASRSFWEAITVCEQAVQSIETASTSDPAPALSRFCMHHALSSTEASVATWSSGDAHFYADSLQAFAAHGPLSTGVWPATVATLPEPQSIDPDEPFNATWYEESLQANGLLAVAANGECVVHTPGAMPPPISSYHLTIRVLTMNRSAPLRRLLNSLLVAEYMGDRVRLEVSIDLPKNGAWLVG